MKLLKRVIAVFPLLMIGAGLALAAQTPQIPLAGSVIPKFVDPLPSLDAIVAGTGQIELQMTEFQAEVLPTGTFTPGVAPKTWVWGYLQPGQTGRASYLGPVIIATRGTPTEMKFVNNLGSAATTNVLAYKYSTDQTLHWADPLNNEANMCNHMAMFPNFNEVPCAQNYAGPIPAVVHLHGGEVPPVLDGGPDAWFTSDGLYKGHGFYSRDGAAATNYSIYRYPNSQEGAPIWFHDHTLGATRLNVYAGLAGGYLIKDPANDPANLPPLVPLVIQDRMFDTNGQLFFPADTANNFLWTPNPEHPYWVPEFVGDVIVVNGKAWPFLNVERKRYTFLLLNGSNARTYEMFLIDPAGVAVPPRMWVIGTDDGYMDKPVQVKKLTMMSGERYQVIVDFSTVPAGTNLILKNTAKTPFPAGAAPMGATTGQIMQFRIGGGAVADTTFNPTLAGATLRGGAGQGPAIKRLVNPATGALAAGVTARKTRQLTLNEVMGMPQAAINPVTGVLTNYPGGPLEVLVNNTKLSGKRINGVDAANMYTFETRPDFTAFTVNGKTTYYSELPNEGDTEVWEIVNLTADAHPIHLHLTSFQLMNRESFDLKKYTAAYNAAFPGGGWDPMTGAAYPAGFFIPGFGPPLDYNTGNAMALGGNPDIAAVGVRGKPLYLSGSVQPPLPEEAGWKDTVITYPGQVTRLAVRWAPQDVVIGATGSYPFDPNGGHGYVWHCHIVDHEDNEMMRPSAIVPLAIPPGTRTYIQAVDY
jgi:FtsP/CotA-like multicopper oxidase with cupredoxin domain